MKTRLFDLKSMPFSQGYAINAIRHQIGGRLLEAGDVLDHPCAGSALYLKTAYVNPGPMVVESIWQDAGDRVSCLMKRENNGEWKLVNEPVLDDDTAETESRL